MKSGVFGITGTVQLVCIIGTQYILNRGGFHIKRDSIRIPVKIHFIKTGTTVDHTFRQIQVIRVNRIITFSPIKKISTSCAGQFIAVQHIITGFSIEIITAFPSIQLIRTYSPLYRSSIISINKNDIAIRQTQLENIIHIHPFTKPGQLVFQIKTTTSFQVNKNTTVRNFYIR
ncbi:hypothetical protein CI610_01993 [invertebrate metagenome]|uniref:Uncharacterized protein n=1 Tax=invertebrate metagenome TaxID=1711999 RepID=A0A2H9T760_9ZZZZ